MSGGTGNGQDEVFSEIAGRLAQFSKSGAPITPETDITRDLNLDSLAVMDLIMELEDQFDVSIPLNLVAEIKTVKDLTETIGRIRNGA